MCVRNSLRVGHNWATTLKVCSESMSKELEHKMFIPEPVHPLHSFHIGKENPGWKLWNPSRHNLRHRGRHLKRYPYLQIDPPPFSQKVHNTQIHEESDNQQITSFSGADASALPVASRTLPSTFAWYLRGGTITRRTIKKDAKNMISARKAASLNQLE